MKKTAHLLQKIVSIFMILLMTGACNKEVSPEPLPDPDPSTSSKPQIKLIEDEVAGTPIVVVGSQNRNFATAFQRTFNGQVRTFIPLQDQLPIVMEDDLGNRWDLFGQAISGPDQGAGLAYVNSGMGFWFVFGAMYPGLEIHQLGSLEPNIQQDTLEGWNIPTSVVAQGSSFDAITALENPPFFTFNQLEIEPNSDFYLDDDDLVVVVSFEGETKVYPHAILDWHEVVNDVIGGKPISVTYCPFTGTAKVWEREGVSKDFSFGVSGLLYNSNVIPFDRATESYWYQLEARSIFGDRLGEQLKLIPHVETTWQSWQTIESSPLLMSSNTGINRDYRIYPYGEYRTSDIISYPLTFDDDRLARKERVFSVIIDGQAKVYRLAEF